MIRALLHRAVAHPAVYDLSQTLAGGRHVAKRIAEAIEPHREGVHTIADIGGGTGLFRDLWPRDTRYICGELDGDKLSAYATRFAGDYAVCMDGASALASESCDAIMAIFVLHHVPDDAIESFIAGCVHALRPGGILVVADPVWAPTRMAGRALWSVDRGSQPRTPDVLRKLVSKQIPIAEEHCTAVFHEYWIAVCRKSH